nr:RDB1 [Oryza sativa Japonica Group]
MDRIFARFFCFLLIAAVSHAADLSPEQYWRSILPNTPMPSSISQLLNYPYLPAVRLPRRTDAGQRNYKSSVSHVAERSHRVDDGQRNYKLSALPATNELPHRTDAGQRNYKSSVSPVAELPHRVDDGQRNYKLSALPATNELPHRTDVGQRNYKSSVSPMAELSHRVDDGQRNYKLSALPATNELPHHTDAGQRNYKSSVSPVAELPHRVDDGQRNYKLSALPATNELPHRTDAGQRNYKSSVSPVAELPHRVDDGQRNYKLSALPATNELPHRIDAGQRNYKSSVSPMAELPHRADDGQRNYKLSVSPAAELPHRVDDGQRNYKLSVLPATELVHYTDGQRNYKSSVLETPELLKDPDMALFFLEKNLQQGKKINNALHFANLLATTNSKFLPRGKADSIPFSSKELPEILDRFGVRPGSDDAAEMSATLQDCELPANKGEKKACATSLESIVDFVTSSFGASDVDAASTVVLSKAVESSSLAQDYTVSGVRRMAGTGQLIACHPESYPYAVFMCHLTEATTRAYKASLVGKDGTAVEAVAVCHTDTSEWNPEHAAFHVLGVKPGTVPVCHFMQPDAVVWTRRG